LVDEDVTRDVIAPRIPLVEGDAPRIPLVEGGMLPEYLSWRGNAPRIPLVEGEFILTRPFLPKSHIVLITSSLPRQLCGGDPWKGKYQYKYGYVFFPAVNIRGLLPHPPPPLPPALDIANWGHQVRLGEWELYFIVIVV